MVAVDLEPRHPRPPAARDALSRYGLATSPHPNTMRCTPTARGPVVVVFRGLLIVAAGLGALLSGCTPSAEASRGARNAVAPSRAQPVVAYDAEARIDRDSGAVAVRTTLSFVADAATSDSVVFLLNRGLRIGGVSGTGVRSYSTSPVPGWSTRSRTVVLLDSAVAPGSSVEMEVRYSGTPVLPESGINRISDGWVELNLDSGWFPWLQHRHQLVGVLRADLPRDWEVLASGEDTFENGVHVIRSRQPRADVAFVAAPSMERVRSERFTVYSADASELAMPVLEAAERCSRYLDERYGATDPLPHGRIVLTDRKTGGYARTNYFVLRRIDPNPIEIHRYLCHELAHHWTIPVVDHPEDDWMTEAFAEFVAGRSVREHFGPAAFEVYVAGWEELGRDHGPIWTPTTATRAGGPAMYGRAPHLLSRLEERIGTPAMDRLVEGYLTGEIIRTEQLLERLRLLAGREAEAWLRDALASEGPAAAS